MTEVLNYRDFGHTLESVTLKSNGISYPDSCSYEVIGNVITSRVYGKDLSLFEIASSGRIAVTLNDIYSFDIKRNNDTNTVVLSTINELDSLTVSTSNVLNMSGYEIVATACNFYLNSPNVIFDNVSDFSLQSDKIEYISSNITLSAPGASLSITPSNVSIYSADSFYIQSSNNGYINSASNLFLDADSKAFLTLSSGTGIASIRGDEVHLLTNTVTGLSEAVKVYYDTNTNSNVMFVSGNLVITGTFETQNVVNTNLTINDKVIEMAYSGEETPTEDGVQNDGAGIQIIGSVSANNNFNSSTDKLEYYKKGIFWKYNRGGIDLLGTSNGIDSDLAESYWDVRGGGMQFTVVKKDENNDLDVLSYGFRINEYDQFEIYKRFSSNGNMVTKRISRWGGCGNIIL